MSLVDLARRTKIPLHVLEAIERDAIDEVPGGLFIRGYLRAYAAEVGLDRERVVREFLSGTTSVSEADLLGQLRARYHVRERAQPKVAQVALAVACVACLLYILMWGLLPDATGDAHHEDQRRPAGISLLFERGSISGPGAKAA